MPDKFHYARITDAVHGTFGISELESDIISTPVFQRLHNIRQLGLANLVYTGAENSRFSHSLGACHIASRMLRGINQNSAKQFDDDEIQMYRLAGLLHDLGHYPFSHAMEYAALDYYKPQAFLADVPAPAASVSGAPDAVVQIAAAPAAQAVAPDPPPPAYHHEQLGRAVLGNDKHIAEVLKKHRISSDDLKAVLSREKVGALTNLVSSDLDCDRLDYLLRTAHCAGLPYGQVDLEYITTQTCVDSEGYLCLTKKALRAADHLLVSRYYDYTQVAFHKTIVALELVLRNVIQELLERQLLDCSGATMLRMITDGSFASFDDQYIIAQIRDAQKKLDPRDSLHLKIDSVLNRHPPKLVASSESIASADEPTRKLHRNLDKQLRDKMREAAVKFKIAEPLWHPWNTSLGLTKIGSRIPLSEATSGLFEEEASQAVRVLTTEPDDKDCKSKPLVEHGFALMKLLSEYRFYAIRLFVHLPDGDTKLRTEIESFFKAELPDFPFSP
jgi:HD superfamily phosphohydrolase